jgi:hypothetical protein
MILTRAISMTNFLVASSALGFQVFVLYPWHIELDERFEELKKEHIKLQRVVETRLGQPHVPTPLAAPRPKHSWWPF